MTHTHIVCEKKMRTRTHQYGDLHKCINTRPQGKPHEEKRKINHNSE